jgi:hypothetical protein
LGWGGENFEIANNKYFDPRLAPYEAWYDRAHNFIFDYGVTLGWLGLLSYLSIFIVVGYFLFTLREVPQKGTESKGHSERSVSEEKNLKTDSSAQWPQDDKIRFLLSSIFISLLVAYLVQNLFIFDSFVSYLMLFFVLELISSVCQTSSFSVIPAKAGIQDSGSRIKCGMTTKIDVVKKLLLFFVIGNLSLVIYMYNLKPFLAANYTNQILLLPASEAMQAAPLLNDALALNSFASPEITYQVVMDYLEKINQNPTLAQNEEFFNLADKELSMVIERSPNQSRNYVALSWLSLYFSGQEQARFEKSLQLAQKIRELSPTKKDAYLLLVAGYSLSSQPQKAAQIVDQSIAIDAKMGEEIKAYLERLK